MDASLFTKENGLIPGNLIEYTTFDGNIRYGILKSIEEFNGQPIIMVDRRGTLISEIKSVKVHTLPWSLWLDPDLEAFAYSVFKHKPFWAKE